MGNHGEVIKCLQEMVVIKRYSIFPINIDGFCLIMNLFFAAVMNL